MSETHFTQGNGAIFIQPDGPGGSLTFLGCHEIASIDEPLGDYTPFWCADPNQPKRFVQAGQTYAPPAATTMQIVEDVVGTLSLLREQECPFGLYVNLVKCGKKSVFANAELTWIIDVRAITNRSTSNVASREGDERMERAYDLSAAPPVIEVRDIAYTEQVLPAASEPLNDIIFCNDQRCAGDCGTALDVCQNGITVSDATVIGDVIYTTNSGTTWTDSAAQPFVIAEDILSATCFAKDKDTTRWLVARGQEAAPANPAEISYSDDTGATWTNVDVESGGTRSAADSGALFSLDWYHIWFVTTDGYIHFSSDGGATWANQFIDSGTNDLHGVHFADENNGFAVGAAGVVFKTDDGGTTWTATTVTDAGQINQCVYVFNADRVMVGNDAGIIYLTTDGGTTWSTNYTGSASINDIMFASNDYVGWALDDDEILRTRNGGQSWESLAGLPSLTELNSVWACNDNLAYVAGEDAANAGIVLRVSG